MNAYLDVKRHAMSEKNRDEFYKHYGFRTTNYDMLAKFFLMKCYDLLGAPRDEQRRVQEAQPDSAE